MTVGHVLLVVASTIFALTLSLRANVVQSPSSPATTVTHVATLPATTSADYLGSKACARCHQEDFDQWQRSLHIRMTKPIDEATVVGDFSEGTRFTDHGRSFEFGRQKGKPFMRVSYGGGPPETFTVDYTLGHKRYQGYLSKLPDGRMYVLPAFWHIESKRWIDWKEITPIPDDAHDLRQIWNTNCFNCHATNLARGFNLATRKYETTWTEMGIGCEACHGPGKPHVELMEKWEKDPASKPTYDNSAKNRELSGILKTFSPRSAPPRQTYDTCSYCHGNKRNAFLGFRGGDRYEDYALPFLISAPIPENDLQGEFWPDGRPNRFNRPQALTMTGCFKAGQVVCTNCHVAHGSRNPFSLKLNITQGRTGDLLCVQCHGAGPPPQPEGLLRRGLAEARPQNERAEADVVLRPSVFARSTGLRDPITPLRDNEIETHTFHKAASAGSRCISCHMSDVNWRLLIRRRDHTFQAPVPEITTAFGVPNACTTCHDNRSPEWAARQMDQWWGNGERRQAALALATTMYRAGSGDAAVLPELARLAVDRSQGLLVRASAVQFMEQLALGTAGTGHADVQSQTSFGAGGAKAGGNRRVPAKLTAAQVNALVGAASDPEAIVRAEAITALLAAGDRDRAVPPIIARLTDASRVVRTKAAEALLALGVAVLPAAAGEALSRAQDEYAIALGSFPDAASNYTELGWLEAERQRVGPAIAAIETAIRLDPKAARPLVIKGVIAAREGRFKDASDLWRKAKTLEPGYPNIDRLIEEAEKRR